MQPLSVRKTVEKSVKVIRSFSCFSILGPILGGILFRDVFSAADVVLPDLQALATQHADAILHGLLVM